MRKLFDDGAHRLPPAGLRGSRKRAVRQTSRLTLLVPSAYIFHVPLRSKAKRHRVSTDNGRGTTISVMSLFCIR